LQPSLSYILPVHNAQDTLGRQVGRLLDVLPDLAARFELVVVDDGSTDHTAEVAAELAHRYPQVRLASHARPRGPEAAARTGVARASGEIVLVQPQGEFPGPTRLRYLWHRHAGPTDIRPPNRPEGNFSKTPGTVAPGTVAPGTVAPGTAAPAPSPDRQTASRDWRGLLDRVRRFAQQA